MSGEGVLLNHGGWVDGVTAERESPKLTFEAYALAHAAAKRISRNIVATWGGLSDSERRYLQEFAKSLLLHEEGDKISTLSDAEQHIKDLINKVQNEGRPSDGRHYPAAKITILNEFITTLNKAIEVAPARAF